MLLAALLLSVAADTIVITDVGVIPMDRPTPTVLEHQTLVVADGRILAMGPATSVFGPRGARVIDGRGKFVIPGLADMHVHLTTVEELPMYVGNGVLTVRDLNGSSETLAWRRSIEAGMMVGPRLFVSGPMIAGPEIPWRNKVVPETPAAADSIVRAQKAEGYDQIKIYDGISKPVFNAAVAAAKRVGMLSSGHIPATVGFDGVLASGMNGLEHLDKTVYAVTQHDLDTLLIPSIVTRIKSSSVWVTPTLESMMQLSKIATGRFDSLMSRPEALASPAGLHEYWTTISIRLRGNRTLPPDAKCNPWCEYQLRLANALSKSGVPLLAGTDVPNAVLVPGYSLLRELALFVEIGLTPYEALLTATINPARFFGQERDWGSVAVGRRANLVVLEQNPLGNLEVLGRPFAVVLDGKLIDAAQLARMRREQ
ncbi:MAG TPA: amidohydrolase family protein [Gemmatimonadaceae bacterium]